MLLGYDFDGDSCYFVGEDVLVEICGDVVICVVFVVLLVLVVCIWLVEL